MRHWTLLPIAMLALAVAIGGCGGDDSSTTPTGRGGDSSSPASRSLLPSPSATSAVAAPTMKVDDDLGRLVPAEAAGLVYVPSLEKVIADARGIVASFDENAASKVDMNMLLGQMLGKVPGLSPEMVDPSKPMAFAMLTPPGGGPTEPLPVIILTVRDPQAALENMKAASGAEGPVPTRAGSFIAFCPSPAIELKVADAAPAIARDLAGGDVSVRLDLEKLLSVYAEAAKGAFGQGLSGLPTAAAPGLPDMSFFVEAVQEGFVTFLESAERLDLALRIDGATVSLQGGLTMKKGSPLDGVGVPAGDLAAVARFLPTDDPLSILASIDWKKAMEWLEPFMDMAFQVIPEDERGDLEAYWKKAMALYDHLGNDFGMAMSFGTGGIEATGVFTAKNAQAYLDAMTEFITSGTYNDMMAMMGMTMKPGEPTEVAGYRVHHYTMDVDAEKLMKMSAGGQDLPPEAMAASEGMIAAMFGKDGMHMHLADVDGKLVYVMGSDALLERTVKSVVAGGQPNNSLTAALEMAGQNPGFLLHMEVRTLARQIMDLMRTTMPPEMVKDMPNIPAGKPIPISIGYGVTGRVYRGGFSIDVGALADLIKAIDK